jgi:hypothetical protein
MASFIKSSRLQTNVLVKVIQRRTRVFPSIGLFNINATNLVNISEYKKEYITRLLLNEKCYGFRSI